MSTGSMRNWKAPRFYLHFEGSEIHGDIVQGRVIRGTVVIFVRMFENHKSLFVYGLTVGLLKSTRGSLDIEHLEMKHKPVLSVNVNLFTYDKSIRDKSPHPLYKDRDYHCLKEGYHRLPFMITIPKTWKWDRAFLKATLEGEYDPRWTNSSIIMEIQPKLDLNKFAELKKSQEITAIETIYKIHKPMSHKQPSNLLTLFSCFAGAVTEGQTQLRTEEKMYFHFKIPRKGFVPGELVFLMAEIKNDSCVNIKETAVRVFEKKVKTEKAVSLSSTYFRKVEGHTSEKFDMILRLPQNLKISKDADYHLQFNVVTTEGNFIYKLPIQLGTIPLKKQT